MHVNPTRLQIFLFTYDRFQILRVFLNTSLKQFCLLRQGLVLPVASKFQLPLLFQRHCYIYLFFVKLFDKIRFIVILKLYCPEKSNYRKHAYLRYYWSDRTTDVF